MNDCDFISTDPATNKTAAPSPHTEILERRKSYQESSLYGISEPLPNSQDLADEIDEEIARQKKEEAKAIYGKGTSMTPRIS